MHFNINFRFLFYTLVIIFCYENTFSQSDTIYLDEEDKQVSKYVFYKKEKSSIYDGVRYSTDSLVLEALELNYVYAKMLPISQSHLFKFLSSNYKIDTTKTIIIHYTFTLKHPKDYPRTTPIYSFDTLSNTYKLLKNHNAGNLDLFLGVSRHMHAQNYRAILMGYKQCLRYHKKNQETTSIVHLFAKNEGFPVNDKGLKWYSDENLFVRKFFNKPKRSFNIVIIQPNGEFYVQYGYSKYDYATLILKEKWGTHIREFMHEMKYLNEI